MKTIIKKIYTLSLIAGLAVVVSCSSNDDTPAPDPITASAGGNLTVDLESLVTIDASGSVGVGISYVFEVTSPAGNAVTLNVDGSSASFRAIMAGTYAVTTTIANAVLTDMEEVTITVVNPIYIQADYMGRPAINTIFNYSSGKVNTNDGKDMYNSNYLPSTGTASYQAQFKGIFDALQAYIGLDIDKYRNIFSVVPGAEGFGTNNGLAGALSADVLNCNKSFATTYGPSDLNNPVPFQNVLNGRALSDDVIDVTLLLTFGGVFVDPNDDAQQNSFVAGLQTDFINANDVAFDNIFPYLAAPH